LLIMS